LKTWIFKHKKSDGGLYFDMGFKLDIGKLIINIVKLGRKAIKLQSLLKINQLKSLKHYKIIIIYYNLLKH